MPDVATADAPGRVNLIGEHTDYHEGFVCPTVTPQRTRVRLERRSDRQVRALSTTLDSGWEDYQLGSEMRGRGWLDYVQGVTAVLAEHQVRLPGFDAHIDSNIPPGAGISSSAALLVSLLRALRTLLDLEFDDVTLARAAHDVEKRFVGVPVGIMDQMASSLGRAGEALFLDTRSLEFERVPIPPSIEIAVIDSGVPHTHAGGQYAERREESFQAAKLLGVEFLRDVSPATLRTRANTLPQTLARRARHVVTENQRVIEAVAALKANDPVRLGVLFAASHASMRDAYEASTPEIDALVTIASHHPDVHGARLTGGGFGGAIVLIAEPGRGRAAADEIAAEYRQDTTCDAVVLVPL